MNFWNWIGLPCAADIQALKEASRKQTEALSTLASLNKNVIQLLEDAENISEKSDKISEAVRTYHENLSRMLLDQLEALSTNLESLKAFQKNFRRMDAYMQRKLKEILEECGTQNELLRLLIANSLIDDVSQVLEIEGHASNDD